MFHKKIFALTLLLTGCTLICAAQLDASLANAELPTIAPVVVAESTTIDHPKLNTTTSTTSTTSTTTTTTTTTTTPKPTTTTTTTTTTPAPTTTTVPVPTTTPAPAPYPEPSIVTWNSSCIMLKMAAQLNFTYVTKDNKTDTALYNVPKEAVVEDAHCETNITQSLQINWGPSDAQHSMVLQFGMKNNTAEMNMMLFTLPLTSDRFPNALENQTIQLIHRGFDFAVPPKMSYHCTRAQVFNLTEIISDVEVIGTVKITDVQVEAFRTAGAKDFSTVRDCDSSETSDLVPIAVGIALAALIAIVLISYLCARRRSTSRGYMSF